MWIKICGNTNLEDAQIAAELGADAVGFVFAPSTRQVTVPKAALITPHLPDSVERVGVFQSQNLDEIAAAVREAGLSAVQLHGDVNATLTKQLNDLFEGRLTIIQTIHWTVDAEGENNEQLRQHLRQIKSAGVVERVLVDSKVGQATGGTGVSFNWGAAKTVLSEEASELKLIVAGGLRSDNVAEAIRELSPWGVDVASGVESVPGRKDPAKLAAFITRARGADTSAG